MRPVYCRLFVVKNEFESGNDSQERGFAAARRSKDDQHLPVGNLKAEIGQCLLLRKLL